MPQKPVTPFLKTTRMISQKKNISRDAWKMEKAVKSLVPGFSQFLLDCLQGKAMSIFPFLQIFVQHPMQLLSISMELMDFFKEFKMVPEVSSLFI